MNKQNITLILIIMAATIGIYCINQHYLYNQKNIAPVSHVVQESENVKIQKRSGNGEIYGNGEPCGPDMDVPPCTSGYCDTSTSECAACTGGSDCESGTCCNGVCCPTSSHPNSPDTYDAYTCSTSGSSSVCCPPGEINCGGTGVCCVEDICINGLCAPTGLIYAAENTPGFCSSSSTINSRVQGTCCGKSSQCACNCCCDGYCNSNEINNGVCSQGSV